MMLAANRYVTRNGTFEPYHATITRIYRRLLDEHGMADVSYPAT
jgi:N-formylglutamate amidohydrolase